MERPPGPAREVDVDGLARLLDELVGVDHADGVELLRPKRSPALDELDQRGRLHGRERRLRELAVEATVAGAVTAAVERERRVEEKVEARDVAHERLVLELRERAWLDPVADCRLVEMLADGTEREAPHASADEPNGWAVDTNNVARPGGQLRLGGEPIAGEGYRFECVAEE